jgi:hypothetical protein
LRVVGLCRLSSAGTQGTGLTETQTDHADGPPVCTAFNGHSSTGPTLAGIGPRAALAGVIGAGVIWTFDRRPFTCAVGTTNGLGLYVPTGTGQIIDFALAWDEA